MGYEDYEGWIGAGFEDGWGAVLWEPRRQYKIVLPLCADASAVHEIFTDSWEDEWADGEPRESKLTRCPSPSPI